MIHVSTKIARPARADVEALGRYSVATIHEAQGRRGALESTIKPVDRDMSVCGPAFTVRCAPPDNIMLQVAITYAQPGDVIVVSGGEYREAGSFGDVLANACLAKGIAGLVTDTGVRDSRELRELGFPVFSFSVCVKGTVKETLGPINDPVIVGGELVRPGDIVRGDADGVVVIRRGGGKGRRPRARRGRLHRRLSGREERDRGQQSRKRPGRQGPRRRGVTALLAETSS